MKQAFLFMKPFAALGAFKSQQAHRSGHLRIILLLELIPSFSCLQARQKKVSFFARWADYGDSPIICPTHCYNPSDQLS
jgi:hypothetical protein